MEQQKQCSGNIAYSDFQTAVEKPQPKLLLRPITTGTGSAMNQSQFLAIICNSLKAREKSRVHGAIGFGLSSHWLKNCRESFKPITKRCNRKQDCQLHYQVFCRPIRFLCTCPHCLLLHCLHVVQISAQPKYETVQQQLPSGWVSFLRNLFH